MNFISNTHVELLATEALFINSLSSAVAEKISNSDLSASEREYWLKRQNSVLEAIKQIAAVVDEWHRQRELLNTVNEPVQEISDALQ